MPFTPYHLGPALLVKGVVPRWFSFSAFAASQVAIDLETLYWLVQDAWPVHRTLHTFVVGSLVGMATGAVWSLGARPIMRRVPRLRELPPLMTETEMAPAITGGLVGGLSHALLDGVMHTDIQPCMPFASGNPLLGLLDEGSLHIACFAAGLVGAIVVAVRLAKR